MVKKSLKSHPSRTQSSSRNRKPSSTPNPGRRPKAEKTCSETEQLSAPAPVPEKPKPAPAPTWSIKNSEGRVLSAKTAELFVRAQCGALQITGKEGSGMPPKVNWIHFDKPDGTIAGWTPISSLTGLITETSRETPEGELLATVHFKPVQETLDEAEQEAEQEAEALREADETEGGSL